MVYTTELCLWYTLVYLYDAIHPTPLMTVSEVFVVGQAQAGSPAQSADISVGLRV